MRRALLPLYWALATACRSPAGANANAVDATPRPAGSAGATLEVRVPSALRVARAIDSLSVEIDRSSEAETTVRADPGMVLGIESETRVFDRDRVDAASGGAGADGLIGVRHGFTSGTTFDVGRDIYNTKTDGLPKPDHKYVAEMKLELFETDVPAGHEWDPHASGRYKVLLTRTIRQAEE